MYPWIWLLLRGIALWTIWINQSDLTFNKNRRWDVVKVKQPIWQSLFAYARVAYGKALINSKREAIYNNLLGKSDIVWGGNGLLYNITWHIRTPNVDA